jgi:hypothetical protein
MALTTPEPWISDPQFAATDGLAVLNDVPQSSDPSRMLRVKRCAVVDNMGGRASYELPSGSL